MNAIRNFVLGFAALSITASAPMAAFAEAQKRPAPQRSSAKPTVNRPSTAQARPAPNNRAAQPTASRNTNAKNYNNNNYNNNRPGARPGNNNVNVGNTVVVSPPRGGYPGGYPPPGYNGGYYNNNDWDNDDDDFLEFIGKTAAVTAGAAIVGSIIKGTPKNNDGTSCQQTISNGVPYMNCNGTWYQAVGSNNYQVVQPPVK